jgi:hypothetical protein
MWIAAICPFFIAQGQTNTTTWSNVLSLASFTASMTVNALVTGLIVFRIFKVFRNSRGLTTSDEKSLGVTGGGKLRSIIFVIIESGMTLFAIQLLRLVIGATGLVTNAEEDIYDLILGIHEMLNVVISSVIVTFIFLLIMWRLGYNTYHHPGAGVNGTVFPRRAIFSRSCQ